jgi:hypothetical protein
LFPQIALVPAKSSIPLNSPVPAISAEPISKLPPPRKTAESNKLSFLSAITNFIGYLASFFQPSV